MTDMNKKILVGAVSVVLTVIAVAFFFLLANARKKSEYQPQPTLPPKQSLTQVVKATPTPTSKTNPFDAQTNPFKIKTNPFE